MLVTGWQRRGLANEHPLPVGTLGWHHSPQLLFLSLWSLPGSEMSEGRLSLPGVEAKFTKFTGRHDLSLPRPWPTDIKGTGGTFPKVTGPHPSIPRYICMVPGPGPSSPCMAAHRPVRGFPFQSGKAQVGRGRGEPGRRPRGLQPGNKTERTNPVFKSSHVSHAQEGSWAIALLYKGGFTSLWARPPTQVSHPSSWIPQKEGQEGFASTEAA